MEKLTNPWYIQKKLPVQKILFLKKNKNNYPIKWSIYLVALERINILAYFLVVAKYVREVAFIFPVCMQSAK